MRNSLMRVRVFVASKNDFNPKSVRPGPEFKCFQCGDWFDGNTWRYTFAKHWYPFLKYPINFFIPNIEFTSINLVQRKWNFALI